MSASCRVVMKKGLYAFRLKHRQALWLPPNHGSIMIVPSPPIAPDYLVVGWHPVLNRALISRLGGNCDELVAAAKAQVCLGDASLTTEILHKRSVMARLSP